MDTLHKNGNLQRVMNLPFFTQGYKRLGGAKYISTGRSLPTERRHFIRQSGTNQFEGGGHRNPYGKWIECSHSPKMAVYYLYIWFFSHMNIYIYIYICIIYICIYIYIIYIYYIYIYYIYSSIFSHCTYEIHWNTAVRLVEPAGIHGIIPGGLKQNATRPPFRIAKLVRL